jgi:glycosyltransferase involved in cell wall biosynthesis
MTIQTLTLKKSNIRDFAKERNLVLKKAKGEWVFFLDSDESVSSLLKKELNNLSAANYDAFYVRRDNYFLGKYIGTDNIVRLGKAKRGRWTRRVHENWKFDGPVGQLRYPIIHNSARSIFEMIGKINNYSTLHAMANQEEGKKSSLFKIIVYPKLKFIESIFAGRGIVFSVIQAFHSFLSWGKQWELQRK